MFSSTVDPLVPATDTEPPYLHSLRVLLFRDGRVGVQLQAGDDGSGLLATSVTAELVALPGDALDSRPLTAITDEFGRCTMFEGVLGPRPPHIPASLSLSAVDARGNRTVRLPRDGALFVVPPRAEWLLDSVQSPNDPRGHPIYAHERLLPPVPFLPRDRTGRPLLQQFRQDTAHEAQRRRELEVLPARLQQWGVNVAAFRRVVAARKRAPIPELSNRLVLPPLERQ